MRLKRPNVECRDSATRPPDTFLVKEAVRFVPKPRKGKAQTEIRCNINIEIPSRLPGRKRDVTRPYFVFLVTTDQQPEETDKLILFKRGETLCSLLEPSLDHCGR